VFSLIGLPFVCLLGVCVLAVPALAAWSWDRPRLRWPRRVVLVVVSQAVVLAFGLAWINRTQDFYGSWSELRGHEAPPVLGTGVQTTHLGAGASQADYQTLDPSASAAAGGAWNRELLADWRTQGSRGSLVVSFALTGPRTHYVLPASVYLPAGYFSAANRNRRYPVVELFPGYPGGPQTWLNDLSVRTYLDSAIAEGRLPPTIAVMVFNDPDGNKDSECVNAVDGAQAATYLAEDVPTAISHLLRVLPGRQSWAAVGYSTGGYCALHLALAYPQRYGAAVSLSGYLAPDLGAATGDVFRGNRVLAEHDNVAWVLTHERAPNLPLLLGAGSADLPAMAAIHRLVPLLAASMPVTTAIVPGGGHNGDVWTALEPAVWNWLGHHLAGSADTGSA
jgi:enterochelin esterase-like enzyme